MSSEFELVTVQSGACSLRSLAFGETFHPVVGPISEAVTLHVRQQRFNERAAEIRGSFVIWDVGLGAAANAISIIESLVDKNPPTTNVELHSFDHDLAPLEFALENVDALCYLEPHRAALSTLVAEGSCHVSDALCWHFHRGDFACTMTDVPAPHAIIYDPYSPRSNPELWTIEHFVRLYAQLDPRRSCLLTNYTRSTAVRVTLLLAGFFVGRGDSTGEKEETTIAANDLSLLVAPLDARWLERVRRSTHSAPLRAVSAPGPITDKDLQALWAHPQFAGRG